ncbi:MAG: chromate transporter [Bacteroidales bacterium]|nr:chromate transporter [Bacteroidales bacterium]MCR4910064.1 chromate transporter [Bacteroidales bacterium]
MIGLLLQIFWCFFVIGLFNFGGGGAMISLIQNQIVEVHGWLTEGAFTDIVAISQTTPGPIGINCATYVGYQVMHDAGYSNLLATIGSASATVAVVLPSFIIFFVLMRAFNRFHDDPRFTTVMSGLKPAVAGLIFAAAVILCFHITMDGAVPQISVIAENFPDWKSWLLFAGAFIVTFFFKANPIYVILAGGILGLILY